MDDFGNISRYKKTTSFFSPSPRRRPSVSFRDPVVVTTTPVSSRNLLSTLEMLSKAIEDNDEDTVAHLILSGPSVNVNEVVAIPGCSLTLLHLAVGFSDNRTPIVEMLLRHGGDPNNKDIEEGLSPLHLSALYDHDKVLALLIEYGGDPAVVSKDGQTCYDIVRKNVTEDCAEKCFSYFIRKSNTFRKSLGLGHTSRSRKPIIVDDSGTSDGFYSCESESQFGGSGGGGGGGQPPFEGIHSIVKRLFPNDYTNLMTEDESVDDSQGSCGSDDDGRNKLTTIPEESGVVSATSPMSHVFTTTPSPFSAPQQGRGIASMTAPIYILTDDEVSATSDLSCINSTPPITPQPTKEDLERLKEQMKTLNIPVTPSTYGVISRYADESRLQELLSPKTGTCNFSSELQAGIQNLNLIHEWGKHKIDFLQNAATPTANQSKSFYNYLLLDPRVIKRVNFSGDHLKAGVITSSEKFEKFLLSVFYIGKAHGKRPLNHLVEAKAKFVEMGRKVLKAGEKIDTILEIWRSGLGVIIVSVFHHSSEREANVNEACMIDAMGLVELSNQKKGSYAGTVASGWPQKAKNQLGSLLLYKSFCSFVVSDAKQFYPQDFS